MGVYQRPSGSWCYEIRGRNQEGKQVTLDARYDFDNKDDATLAWLEAKKKVKIRTTRFLFRNLVAARLEHLSLYTYKEEHEKVPRSYANDRKRLSRFGAWVDLPAEEITREMVKDELKKLLAPPPDGEGLTAVNVNKHLIALKAAFNHAINEGKLTVNPAKGIDFFPEDDKAPKFIPEPDQLARILLLAKPIDRAYLTVVAYTAARISEINKLTWEDVRWNIDGQGHAAVGLWTWKKKDKRRVQRWVPVTYKVKKALKEAHKYRIKNSPWVFTNPEMVSKYPENPIRWRWIYRDKFFATLCDRAGVPRMGYHNLRHLASCNIAAKRAALTDIQQILGHERATTTDIYLRSLGFNGLRGAAEMMEGMCDFLCDSPVAQNNKPL